MINDDCWKGELLLHTKAQWSLACLLESSLIADEMLGGRRQSLCWK